jgi:hypothetical protein
VLESAFFGHDRVPGYVLDLRRNGITLEVANLDAGPRERRYLAVTEEKQVPGVDQNRWYIRSNEVLVLAKSYHYRRTLTDRDYFLRFVREHNCQGIDAAHFGDSSLDRSFECWLTISQVLFDQVRDYFRISVGNELVALSLQFLFEGHEVLDDTVVNDYHAPSAVAMRVCIFLGWPPVSCPSRVTNAIPSVQRMQPYRFFQVVELAFRSPHCKGATLVNNCDSRRVITTIFELPQPVQYDSHDLFVTDVSDYAAHIRFTSLFSLATLSHHRTEAPAELIIITV